MNLEILAIGTATPRFMIDQKLAAEIAKTYSCETAEQARLLPILYRRTGVKQRGSTVVEEYDGTQLRQSFFPPASGPRDRGPTTAARVARYAEDAPALAFQAASAALEKADMPASRITQLITVSCTGFVAPGIDAHLIKRLGLRPTIGRTHVGYMGCHGALNALRVAHGFAGGDPEARVLLCAVELCSLHYRYGWDPEMVVANALFADGAAALVGAPQGTSPHAWQVASSGSCLLPDSEDAMSWSIGDHGFNMTLSARVPNIIQEHLRPWMSEWLGGRGLRIEQVASWAIHPGGPRIVSSAAEALGLPKGATAVSDEVLNECGNMSSPTVLFILERLIRSGAPRPCVALAFGPGLVAETALLL